MKENISRTAGNVYEKMDKDNWMVIPSYSEVQKTSHVDVGKVALFPENEQRPLTGISDEDVIEIVRKNLVNND